MERRMVERADLEEAHTIIDWLLRRVAAVEASRDEWRQRCEALRSREMRRDDREVRGVR